MTYFPTLRFGALSCVLVCSACSGADPSARELATGDATSADAGGTAGPGQSGGDDLTTQGDLDECASVKAQGDIARAPVDIIWVVDASGSMVDEQQRIQENLEVFAGGLDAAGVDAHVVMLTADDIGSCTTLAGTPEYLFVEADVDSSNALVVLLDDFPAYAAHLRPAAVKHFIVVTDDESEISAAEFRSQMEAKLGGSFVLHAIASEDTGMSGGGFGGFGGFGGACMPETCDDDVTGACGGTLPGFGGFGGFGGGFCGATRPGKIYYELADATDGEKISICEQDWGGVFARLQTAVIATSALPCELALPMAPDGKILDPNLVRVDFVPTGESSRQFPRAKDASACGTNQAWHYDDANDPSQIVLCPAACDAVAVGGSLELILACTPDDVQLI